MAHLEHGKRLYFGLACRINDELDEHAPSHMICTKIFRIPRCHVGADWCSRLIDLKLEVRLRRGINRERAHHVFACRYRQRVAYEWASLRGSQPNAKRSAGLRRKHECTVGASEHAVDDGAVG